MASLGSHRHCWLLRARRERPRNRGADQRDELAPFQFRDHSITSSARARSEGGTSKRSALAVLRLITSSNLLDCTTGRSAGLAPLRTGAVYSPTSRQVSAKRVP